MTPAEQHAANLARVEALRNHEGTVDVVALTGVGDLNVTETVGAHIEDVLARHEPYMDCFDANDPVGVQLHCAHCVEPYDQDTNRCPDYASALRLLDALDGGAK